MDAVDTLIAGIEAAAVPSEVFADDAVLDATVPNWRFTTLGAAAIQGVFAGWFADPGSFRQLHRSRLADLKGRA